MRAALAEFGADAAALTREAYRRADVVGYLEVHIEQGPVLDQANEPLGVVTAIASQGRYRVTRARRGGTRRHRADGDPPRCARRARPRSFRLVEAIARKGAKHSLVATVGDIKVKPGAGNVIPGIAEFTLDVRAADDQHAARRGGRNPPRRHARSAHGAGSSSAWRPFTRSRSRPARRGCGRRWRGAIASVTGTRAARDDVRRRPRRAGDGPPDRHRHDLRALPRRHQPQPAGIGRASTTWAWRSRRWSAPSWRWRRRRRRHDRRHDRRELAARGRVPEGAGADAERQPAGRLRGDRRGGGAANWRRSASRSSGTRCPPSSSRENGMISATNLIVRHTFGTGKGPVIALNAHGDVVPPGERLDGRSLRRGGARRRALRARRRGLEIGFRHLCLRAARADGQRRRPRRRHRAALHLRRGSGRRDRPEAGWSTRG